MPDDIPRSALFLAQGLPGRPDFGEEASVEGAFRRHGCGGRLEPVKVKLWEVSNQFWEGVMPLIPRPPRISLSYFHLKGGIGGRASPSFREYSAFGWKILTKMGAEAFS